MEPGFKFSDKGDSGYYLRGPSQVVVCFRGRKLFSVSGIFAAVVEATLGPVIRALNALCRLIRS